MFKIRVCSSIPKMFKQVCGVWCAQISSVTLHYILQSIKKYALKLGNKNKGIQMCKWKVDIYEISHLYYTPTNSYSTEASANSECLKCSQLGKRLILHGNMQFLFESSVQMPSVQRVLKKWCNSRNIHGRTSDSTSTLWNTLRVSTILLPESWSSTTTEVGPSCQLETACVPG